MLAWPALSHCLTSYTPVDSVYDTAEDCPFASVYTPTFAAASDGTLSLNKTKLPVYIWIAGGGYMQLYNSNYNGTEIIRKSHNGIVVVTFNYRVGALGFLAGQQVAQNGSLIAGLLDQRYLSE